MTRREKTNMRAATDVVRQFPGKFTLSQFAEQLYGEHDGPTVRGTASAMLRRLRAAGVVKKARGGWVACEPGEGAPVPPPVLSPLWAPRYPLPPPWWGPPPPWLPPDGAEVPTPPPPPPWPPPPALAEVDAMRLVWGVLRGLSPGARRRVVDWLTAQLAEEGDGS